MDDQQIALISNHGEHLQNDTTIIGAQAEPSLLTAVRGLAVLGYHYGVPAVDVTLGRASGQQPLRRADPNVKGLFTWAVGRTDDEPGLEGEQRGIRWQSPGIRLKNEAAHLCSHGERVTRAFVGDSGCAGQRRAVVTGSSVQV